MKPFAWSFVGTHEHKLDGQHRFSFPGAWRSNLEKSGHGQMIAFLETELNPETQEEMAYMAILPNDVVQERVERLSDRAFDLQDGSEEAIYDSFAAAETLSWDTSGRITVPKKYVAAMGLVPKQKDVLVLTGRLKSIRVETQANAQHRKTTKPSVNVILTNRLPQRKDTGTDNTGGAS